MIELKMDECKYSLKRINGDTYSEFDSDYYICKLKPDNESDLFNRCLTPFDYETCYWYIDRKN